MSERKPTLDDVFVVHENSDVIEDGQDCAVCGDEFEPEQRAVYVPAGFGPPNLLCLVHLHCAVKGDEIELTGTVQS